MPINLELKIKLTSHSGIKEILRKTGAIPQGILKQKDIYFKTETGLLKLRIQNDKNELIKYTRDEGGKSRWSNYEILIINGKNIEKYFQALFNIETVVVKNRELWMYKYTRIHLDKVKNLGCFLELETLVIDNKKSAKQEFYEIIEMLHLSKKNPILSSYRDLILQKK